MRKNVRFLRRAIFSTTVLACGVLCLLLLILVPPTTPGPAPAPRTRSLADIPSGPEVRHTHDLSTPPRGVTAGAPPTGPRSLPASSPAYWANISGSGAIAPDATLGGSVAFDTSMNTTVFLGGDYEPELGGSWTYNDYNWSLLSSGVPDVYAGLAYDSSDSELIAFGGGAPIPHEIGTTIPTNATYGFSGGAWLNLTSSLVASPPAAADPIMASDPSNDSALLLDPVGAANHSQTWIFSNGSWTNVTSTAGTPPPGPTGSDSVMVYDPAAGAVIFFGGSIPGPGYAVATNETWEFSNGRWTDLNISGPDFSTGAVQTMGYDGAADALVDLVAPSYLYSLNGSPDYQDWEYEGGAWSNQTEHLPITPPIGYDPLSVWDPADGYLFYMAGGFDNQSWALGSLPLQVRLVVSPAPIDIGNQTSFYVHTTGGAPPLMYAYSGLPAGCEGASVSVLACQPSGAGNFTIRVSVEDFTDSNATATAPLVVGTRLMASDPILSAGTVYNGTTVAFSVTASGGIPPYYYEWSALPLGCIPPDAAHFNCSVDRVGTFTVSVTVTDSTFVASVDVLANLTVASLPRIESFSASVSRLEVGQSFNLSTRVIGGAPTLEYNYTNLPSGCHGISEPALNCAPTASGVFNITLTVTDALRTRVTASLEITILPAVTISGEQVVPNPATVGSTVTFNYTVSGGEGPFHSDWVDLPPGCAASQAAFGCPMNTPGTFEVGVTVRDALGGTAHSNLTLVVTAGAGPTGGASGLSAVPLWTWAAIGVGVLVVGVLLVSDQQRRRRASSSGAEVGSGSDEGAADPGEGLPPGYEPPPTFPGDGPDR
jgi:hypothetical protein